MGFSKLLFGTDNTSTPDTTVKTSSNGFSKMLFGDNPIPQPTTQTPPAVKQGVDFANQARTPAPTQNATKVMSNFLNPKIGPQAILPQNPAPKNEFFQNLTKDMGVAQYTRTMYDLTKGVDNYQKAVDDYSKQSQQITKLISSQTDPIKKQKLAQILSNLKKPDINDYAPSVNKTVPQLLGESAKAGLEVGLPVAGLFAPVAEGALATTEGLTQAANQSAKSLLSRLFTNTMKALPANLSFGGAYGLSSGVAAGQTSAKDLAISTGKGAVSMIPFALLAGVGSTALQPNVTIDSLAGRTINVTADDVKAMSTGKELSPLQQDIARNIPGDIRAQAVKQGSINYTLPGKNTATITPSKLGAFLGQTEKNVTLPSGGGTTSETVKPTLQLSSGKTEQPNIEFKTGKQPSQQFDAQNNKSIITLPKNVSQDVVWHEVAHAIDRQNPTLRETLAPELKAITGSDFVNNEVFANAFKILAGNPELQSKYPETSKVMNSVNIPQVKQTVPITKPLETPTQTTTIAPNEVSPTKPVETPVAQEKVTPPLSNEAGLAQEAKKYKTADEFVNSQSLYHGTPNKIEGGALKFGAGSQLKKGGYMGGHFLTDDPEIAKAFSFGGETYQASGSLKDKVLDVNKNKNLFESFIGKKYKSDGEMIDFTRQDFESMFPQGKADWSTINQDATEQIAKQLGKDGIAIPEYANGKQGTTYQMFTDNIPVKTRQELTDIYNQAHSSQPLSTTPKTTTPKVEQPKPTPKQQAEKIVQSATTEAKDSFTTSKFYKGTSAERNGRTINNSKINSTEDVQQLHNDLNDRYKKLIQDVKGGVKPNEVAIKEAEALGWDIEKIKSIPENAMLNDAQTIATAQIKANLTLELAETARAYEQTKSAELVGKMSDLVSQILAVDKVVRRSETYLGRAIHAKTITPIPKEFDESVMDIIKKAGIDQVTDIQTANKASNKLLEATPKDVFWSVYYNSILSGTSTHFKNFLDTGFNTILEQGIIENVRNPLNILEQLKTVPRAIRKGWQDAADVMSGKTSPESKYDLSASNFKNWFITKIESVGKLLSAEDAFWKGVNKEHSLVSLAYEQAKREVGIIKAIAKSKEYIKNPTTEMADQIVKEALRNTYNQKPEGWVGAVANGWGNIVRKAPLLRFLQPFSMIVGNVLNAGIDWTPLGFKRAYEYKKAGGEYSNREMWQQLARATMGTIGMGFAFKAAMDNLITGSGPADANQRNQLIATGWQANSIKVGNHYFSYANYGAWSIPLAIVANYADGIKYNKLGEKDLNKKVAYAILGTAQTITDKSFLSNLSQLFSAMKNNDPKYLQKFAANIVTSPYPNLLRQIGGYFNDKIKDPQNVWDYVKNGFGYPFNKSVDNKMDVFGDTATNKTNILGRIFGQQIIPKQNTELSGLLNHLSENDVTLTVPTKTTKITLPGDVKSRTMNDQELKQYQEIYGKNLKLELLTYKDTLNNADGEILDKWMNKIKDDTASISKYQLFASLSGNKMDAIKK